ncbi:hypothetical protein ACTXT7_003944 [Hymenolepis weldensis]
MAEPTYISANRFTSRAFLYLLRSLVTEFTNTRPLRKPLLPLLKANCYHCDLHKARSNWPSENKQGPTSGRGISERLLYLKFYDLQADIPARAEGKHKFSLV